MRVRPAFALASLLGISACNPAYVTQNQSSVLFIIAAVNGGKPLASDVNNKGTISSDSIPVAVAVRSKNPNVSTVPQVAMAVIVERYEVAYTRSDGRNVEGVDVPYRISGNVTTTIDVATSGTSDVVIEVVRLQAKLEPPLKNLSTNNGSTVPGGGLVFTVFAHITIHGRTVAGQAVNATGTLQIDFADFA